MPNIIEQQDLLKGLPDARLAMLLQNPVADIPPFLVAAEAQRRQALRQQFSGDGNKESVVDSLTKQLAKVPQNIGSKSSPTESPDLKSILEKSEEIQDKASSLQEKDQGQGMASGGVVRRFAGGGVASLAPKGTYYGFSPGIAAETAIGSLARASSVVPQTMGVMPGNIGYQAKPAQPQNMADGGMVQRYQYGGSVEPLYEVPDFSYVVPRVVDYVGNAASGFYDFLTTSYAEREKRAKEEEKSPIAPMTPEELAEFNASVALPKDVKVGRKKREEPVAPPVPEIRPEPGETPDQFRARLEALYAVQEPSDLEKAERWFTMAEQFFDPSKTTMQSIAGAGRAFAESAGEQARAQREMDFAREKALLERDMQIAERDRAAKVAERERTTLSANEYANVLIKSRDSLSDLITSKRKQLAELESNPMASDEAKEALKSDLITNEKQFETISGQLAALGISAYGEVPYDVFSLTGGFKR